MKGQNKIMGRLALLMALSYFIQTYTSNPGIADLPLTLYLKETLGLSAREWAQFQGIVFMPWMIKPLWGMIADSFPLFGYSIKSYLLFCYVLTFFVFLGLSQIPVYTASILLLGFTLISTCIAFSDVLADKLMLVRGKPKQQTGILQAAQWSAAGLGGAVMYYLSGWIAKHCSLSMAFLISAAVPFIGLVATLLLLKEDKVERGAVSMQRSLRLLWRAVRSRYFLAIMLFTVLLAFSPTPPLTFYQRDVLHFAEDFLGNLSAIWSLTFGLGAIAFGILAAKISRGMMLHLTVGMSAIATLSLVLIVDHRSATLVQAFNGFTYAIALLGVLEITVKVCPLDIEGTSYALLLSASNLATTVGSISGGWLYDSGVTFTWLVIISAGFTSLCWFLIPLLKLEQAEQ
jgi:predicted MFS family arabinose efflux permease